MRRAAIAITLLLASAALARAEVHVGINIGIPPPPAIVFPEPPPLIVVPRSPVYYAPAAPYPFFYYDGLYYVEDRGYWFTSGSVHGPWRYVRRVPRHILAVPARYRHVPPGHLKHHGKHHGRGHGHGHGHD
ncbi:MAG TPA: hypothetical protein VKA21_10380 [Candidatus Binatia bacterium]|nr:hypothetical protein [Candidatus Binatia bacterium]